MKTLFEKYLRIAKKEKKLVSIRTDELNSEKFSVGYIIGINDELVSIQAISPQGLPDGIFTVVTKDIYGIDIDDRYLQRLKLKEEKKDEIYAKTNLPNFFANNETKFETIIEKALVYKVLIHVNLYRDIGLYGFVREKGQNEFFIEVYNEYGEYDGLSVFLMKDIKNINWDDEDIRCVKKLIDLKNTGPNIS